MRRLFFLSSGALALVVGCGLVGTYDYDDYAGIPKAESSSSSGTAGLGGMGGTGGTGGMTPECPPEGGMITPDLCDNGVDEDCSGGDCTVNAEWSGRFGDGYHQQVRAISATEKDGFGIAGAFTGMLALAGRNVNNTNLTELHPFVFRLDNGNNAVFAYDIKQSGFVDDIAIQGPDTFVTGYLLDQAMPKPNRQIFIRKLDSTGAQSWNILWGNNPGLLGASIRTTNAPQAPVFAAGNITGETMFPINCPGAPGLNSAKSSMYLMSIAPTTLTCSWGVAIEDATMYTMAVNGDHVVIAGFYAKPLIGLTVPPPNDDIGAFIVAYHPATHEKQWEKGIVPEQTPPMNPRVDAISFLTTAIAPNGNTYAAGTFKGSIKIGNSTYVSEGGGTNYDLFVVGFDGTHNGDIMWFDHFGGTDIGMLPTVITQVPLSLAASNDAVYLAGKTPVGMAIQRGETSGPLCNETSCGFLLKLNPLDGATKWARVLGSGEGANDPTLRLGTTSDTLWLGGGWSTDVDFGMGTLKTIGAQDAILARFSPLP